MASVTNYGGANDPLSAPPLGGPGSWAEAVAAALDGSDIPVDARIVAALTAYAPLASPALTGNPTAPTPAAGDNDTSIATTAFAAERATVGNLLTANQASAEGGWSSDGTIDYSGSGAFAITTTFTYLTPDNRLPVLPGVTYTVSGVFTAGCQMQVSLVWKDPGGATISPTTSPFVAAGTSAPLSFSAVAPAGAASVSIEFYSGAGTRTATAITNLGLWAGAGGEWAMPGVPITGLGTRITRPNTDDRLIEQWNPNKAGGAGWSVVDYDSGWRSVTSGFLNGWTGNLLLRRSGGYLTFNFLPMTPGSSQDVFTLPTGFRQSILTYGMKFVVVGDIGMAPFSGNIFQSTGVLQLPTSLGVFYATSSPLPCESTIPTSLPGTLISAAPA